MSARVVLESGSREEWLAARRQGLGGSDISALFLPNRFKTPLDVWLDKITGSPDVDSEPMFWGRRKEPLVAQVFAERHPELVVDTDTPMLLQHPDVDCALASLDGLILNKATKSLSILEVKCGGSRGASNWKKASGEELIPAGYALQAQWYMAVTGLPQATFAVLLDHANYFERVLPANPGLQECMVSEAQKWWDAFVVTSTPPTTSSIFNLEGAFHV